MLRRCEEKYPELVPYIAINFFAGLRPQSETSRLNWEKIDLEQNQIEVMKHKISSKKANRKRYVKIENNLYEWLKIYKKESGAVTPKGFRRMWENLLVDMGYYFKTRNPKGTKKWAEDTARHSYATYWIKKHGEIKKAECATLMGSSLIVVENFYKKSISGDGYKDFWNIYPSGHQERKNQEKINQFKKEGRSYVFDDNGDAVALPYSYNNEDEFLI